MQDFIAHYGVKRRSGRYPWGSGKDPYQHSGDFLARVTDLKKRGMTEKQIADTIGLSTGELRMQLAIANKQRRAMDVAKVKSLQHQGKSVSEIARIMDKNESSIRSLLDPDSEYKMNACKRTADFLKEQIKEKGQIDIGKGVEIELGISRNMLDEAAYMLQQEGYNLYGVPVQNVTNPDVRTTVMTLAPKDMTYGEAYNAKINSVLDYHSDDKGDTFTKGPVYPSSIDSKRIEINYGDQGGAQMDGVIQLRPGVKDLDLGNSHYAQVRIMVDGKYYLKGMAIYADDLPDGIDVRFNTNKPSGTDLAHVLKKIKTEDPDNPFGANIKARSQTWYDDPVTGEKKLNAVNKVKEEGDWFDNGAGHISSQMLSKQPVKLAEKQLNIAFADKQAQYEEIMSINNPTVKKKMLWDFAEGCDKAAVTLEAASFPRQKTEVLLPVPSLKSNEVFAPNYKNGEKLALVRFPHEGIYEIPIVTVNNNHPTAKKLIGLGAKDAIGISMDTAQQLSGADFDGDTALCIPISNKVRINAKPYLQELVGFDGKIEYGTTERPTGKKDKNGKEIIEYISNKTGKPIKPMNDRAKQLEMGKISNLITDMTMQDATDSELARATKHSQVVIDAEKHKLDYKLSEQENGIKELKKKYQGHYDKEGKWHEGGAGTIISAAGAEAHITKRVGSAKIDPTTGEKYYTQKRQSYTIKDDKGRTKEIERTTKVTRMEITKDARDLIGVNAPVEKVYAAYANNCKALANKARLEYLHTPTKTYDPKAAKAYSEEVESLNSKLKIAEANAPRERIAQYNANTIVKAQKQDNPNMTKDAIKKARQRAIISSRNAVSASGQRSQIKITDREWEVIQAGAISNDKASRILQKCDQDRVKQLATPHSTTLMSPAKIAKAKAMQEIYSNSDIAEALGVSVSTLQRALKGS